jgi:hypothetical protein
LSGAIDPHGICVDQGPASCGTNGGCDGTGACQFYGVGTVCSPTECIVATFSLGVCNPSHSCIVSYSSCAPYACLPDASGCHVNCNGGDSDCAAGYYCAGGELCMPKKNLGASCDRNAECLSNVCPPVPGAACVAN